MRWIVPESRTFAVHRKTTRESSIARRMSTHCRRGFPSMMSLRSHRLRLSFAAFTAIFFAAAGASAEKTIRVPADQASIAKAMEGAASGDTVLVAPGTYKEIVLVKEGVVLRSESGPENTIISFGEPDPTDKNQAVLSLQRCTNSTQ